MTDTRDAATIDGFGDEWATYDQTRRTESDLRATFERYTALVDWERLPSTAIGLDLGCGSGRWARFALERLGGLIAVDASPKALAVAARSVSGTSCVLAAAGALPIRESSLDFGYSLGVLHHTTDPAAGLTDLVRCLKPGAPCLVYVYYALDNRPSWYRALWRTSDWARIGISRSPFPVRRRVADAVALAIYWPLSRLAGIVARFGGPVRLIPLSSYRDKPFYVLRTDALDRLGTRVESRFSRQQVHDLLRDAGLEEIAIADTEPFWCAVGVRPDA